MSSLGKMVAKGRYSGRDGLVSWLGLLTGAQSELLRIINMKSGSLTRKNGGTIGLTPRDLDNHYIALLCRSDRGPVKFVWAQR